MDKNSESSQEINDQQLSPSIEPTKSPNRLLLRIIGLIFVFLAVVLGVYGTVAFLAWRSGQTQRTENAAQALDDELEQQFVHAGNDLDAGNFILALRRLEWILSEVPDYPGASSLLVQAQSGLNAQLTPSPAPTSAATPYTPSPPLGPDPEEPFSDITAAVEDEDWSIALPMIIDYQAQFPNFRRQETDTMLYNAYIEEGIRLLIGEQVELGLFYLSQAEKLGDLPLQAEDYRLWADLYLTGISYYGVNWRLTVFYFRDLCAAAPFYQDACLLFHEALEMYADQYAVALDWCPARDLYQEAFQLETDEKLTQKLSDARTRCLEATPTPTIAITSTITITGTPASG